MKCEILCIVIAMLISLVLWMHFRKEDGYKKPEKCDCSAELDEGYDIGVTDGLNALIG